MADNVAQSIKDLQKDLAALDKQLLSNNANWDKLGQTIVDSLKRGGLGLDDLFSKMKGQKDVLKLRAIIDRDALMDDVKKLQTAVDKGLKSAKIGGVEITGQKQIEQALDGYKAQLKLVPKTLAEAYDYAVKIANTLSGSKVKEGTAWSRARADEMNARKKAIDDVTRTEGRLLKLEQELSRYKEGGSRWKNVKSQIEAANKELEVYREKLKLLASRGKSALDANTGTVGFSKETKQLIQEGRDATREAERLAKVRQKDAEWQEQQRRNTEAQFVANGKAIEQQRKLADQIDVLTRKRQALAKYTTDSSAAFDSRNYPLASAYQKQIEDLIRLRQQLDRQFSGSMKAGDLAFADTKTLRDQEEAQKRITAEQKQRDKERADAARQRAAIERKADSESLANQRRQIQIKAQLSAIDKARNSDRDVSSKRAKTQVAEENAEYKRLSAELTRLIARQKELNAISQGSGSRSRGRLQTYEITASEQALRRYEEAWRRVNREQKSSDDNMRKMLSTVSRLASAFGVAFSVQGLVNFGRKLVETRGEFEMQFVAMKQIIGDVDAATKIWNQTMQQALQSPFKAMQLVDYTKKLAAYRIETDKLFDTTKRLADVSAGLGVDMGRLILAYGQVKAANFLRASEIRQFTEAGVNIVGQLSEYFTQLEGRAVSTADVMERVTKRMVLFEDVEEIFKRMTDEGGTFYNMQEVQADTVRGQINKLHDAYDQMLNTIGQANQGTIRNLIESANSLVRNWRDVASFLMKNVNAFVILLPLLATYRKGAKLAASETFTWTRAMRQIGLELTFARNGMKKFSISTAAGTAAVYMFKGAMEILKTTFRTFVPFLAIEGLMLLVTKMQAADRAANQLTKDLDEVGKRNAQSLQDNIDGFTNLVERLKRATEGSQDYLDIRNKIQSQYGEYLDNLEAEQITVENLANSYDRVVERMREKSRQHIMEEGLQEITNAYGDAIVKFQKNITGFKFTSGLQVSDKEAADIAKKMYELYAKDESYRGMQNPVGLLKDALKQYYGESSVKGLNYAQLSIGNALYKSIETRYNKQIELETKANSLTRATANTHQEYLDQLALEEEHQENINKIQQKVQSKEKTEYELQLEKIRYDEKRLELQAKYEKKSSEWLDKEKKKLKENYDAFLKSYNARVEAYVGSVYGKNWREVDNEKAFMDYNAMVATQSRIAQGQSRWEESILNDKKVTEENIKRLKEEQATQTAKDAEASKHLNDELTKENHRLAIIKKQMELLGLHEKDKSKGSYSNNGIYGDRIRLLQDMLQKYKQAAKEAYGYAKAEGKVAESFEDAWSTIMPSGYGELEVPTSYSALADMLQRLEQFTPQFDKNGKLSKMMADLKKAIADALSNVDLEMSVRIREDFGRQIEEAFGNYELTLELQKLNLPSDVLSDLFDLETVDLSDLRRKVVEFYNERLAVEADPTDLIKQVEGYYKKIDDMERKQQRDRIKDYAKYLEYELSERAKIEMEYTRKSADVAANQAFTSEQKEQIQKRLKEERDKAIAKQEWEDFKSSETYIQMMEDLEHQGTNALIAMRTELERIRENAENLSPRALKEVVNALEKIDEITIRRGMPISNIRNAAAGVRSARVEALESGLSWGQVSSRKAAKQTQADIKAQLLPMEQQFNILQSQLGAEKEIVRLEQERYENGLKLGEIFGETFMTGDNEYLQELITNSLTNIESSQERINELTEQRKTASEADTKAIDQKLAEERANLECLAAERDLLEKQLELNIAISKEALNRAATPEERASLQARINELEEELKKLREQDAAVGNLTKKYGILGDSVQGAVQKLAGWSQQAVDVFNSFKTMMTSLGVDTDTDAWDDWSTAFETIGTVASTAASMATKIATGDYVGATLDAIKGIMDIVTQWAGNNDRALERQIQKQQERIDALSDAYARLERQIERTWSSVTYMQTYEQQVQNIREQISAMEAQMAAEREKKNTDDNAVRQYQRDIQDAYDQLDELEQKSIEVFGGIGEEGYRSAAEGFVDAWKSAFLETGDGLQGLQDHFDEFLQDWFVKQATMRIAGGMLEPVFRQIDAAVDKYGEGGTSAMLSEIERVRDMAAAIFPDLSLAFEDLAGMFGVGGEGSLSGLAAGIQGMTEEQANILEAYWNSVRMYTASIDQNVAMIASALGVGGNSPSTNPQLQQLQLIAASVQATHQLLQSTSRSGHPMGGYGFKVFND